jgi:hypothetical protein
MQANFYFSAVGAVSGDLYPHCCTFTKSRYMNVNKDWQSVVQTGRAWGSTNGCGSSPCRLVRVSQRQDFAVDPDTSRANRDFVKCNSASCCSSLRCSVFSSVITHNVNVRVHYVFLQLCLLLLVRRVSSRFIIRKTIICSSVHSVFTAWHQEFCVYHNSIGWSSMKVS